MNKIFLLLLFCTSVYSQTITDSLYFESAMEKQTFYEIENKKAFQLLYLIGNPNQEEEYQKYLEPFYTFITEVNTDFKKNNIEKRVQHIYDKIDEQYFERYVENAEFSDIFKDRSYNCVTATALHAIAFDYLEIPFEIREMPECLYLIVYPNTHRIVFDSMKPSDEIVSVNERQLRRYIEYLLGNKLISEKKAEEMNTIPFLHEYHLADHPIELTELVGIQYYNQAVAYFENNDHKMALIQCEKAMHLHQGRYIKDWRILLSYSVLFDEKTLSSGEYCSLLSRVNENRFSNEYIDVHIETFFLDIAFEQIKGIDGCQTVERIKTCLLLKVEEQELKNEILYIGNRLQAEHHYYNHEYPKALNLLEELIHLEKPEIKSLTLSCVGYQLDSISNGPAVLDSFRKYEEIFPFITDDEWLRDFGVWAYMDLIYSHFEKNEHREGSALLNEFKKKYSPDSNVEYPHDMLGVGFGAASAYFVRQENYPKARQLLLEGLAYEPDSFTLKRKLKVLDDFLKDK